MSQTLNVRRGMISCTGHSIVHCMLALLINESFIAGNPMELTLPGLGTVKCVNAVVRFGKYLHRDTDDATMFNPLVVDSELTEAHVQCGTKPKFHDTKGLDLWFPHTYLSIDTVTPDIPAKNDCIVLDACWSRFSATSATRFIRGSDGITNEVCKLTFDPIAKIYSSFGMVKCIMHQIARTCVVMRNDVKERIRREFYDNVVQVTRPDSQSA